MFSVVLQRSHLYKISNRNLASAVEVIAQHFTTHRSSAESLYTGFWSNRLKLCLTVCNMLELESNTLLQTFDQAAWSSRGCFKAASHDSQKLVITTSKRPTTWRRRYLDHSHVLGKKVIIFPSFDADASGQLKESQCQCKIVLKFCLKQ